MQSNVLHVEINFHMLLLLLLLLLLLTTQEIEGREMTQTDDNKLC